MSQFDAYTDTQYVQGLRRFLRLQKTDFLRNSGLTDIPAAGRKGRLPRYRSAAIQSLEGGANLKARRAETASDFAERYAIARDYKYLSNAEVARLLGVSRELTRLWSQGKCRPKDLSVLADALDVPLVWLELGGGSSLPADSHIGVRVGLDAMHFRERLFELTSALMAEIPDDADENQVRAFIEKSVRSTHLMANTARRAGGRWQLADGKFVFAPWVPIQEHGLTRRYWSDDVEAMIEEELASNSSVYGAWHQLKERCEAMGLSKGEYPRLVTLHKRIANSRERAKRFGVRFYH